MSSEPQLHALYEQVSRMTSSPMARYTLKQIVWNAYYVGYTDSHTESGMERWLEDYLEELAPFASFDDDDRQEYELVERLLNAYHNRGNVNVDQAA